MKKHISTIILVFILLIGLSLLLYPTLSDYWNSFHQSKAIAGYVEQVAAISEDEYTDILARAKAYNAGFQHDSLWVLSEEETKLYNSMLNVGSDGIMGYIEIPVIGCSLPIYHGTAESVLQVAVGHIEGSSLPVGGTGTHCVISGHRGLPSAKLFTDLDRLVVGDIFTIYVLNEVLTYEVDSILIVEPDEVDSLKVYESKDLCTLVTCTPYGVNSHRLLVQGHRIENIEETPVVHIVSDAMQIDSAIVAPIVAIPILFVLLIILLVRTRKKR